MDQERRGDPPGRYGFGTWSTGPSSRLRSPWRAVGLAFALVVAGFLVAIVLFNLVGLFVDPQSLSVLEFTLLGLVLLQGMAFPTVAVGYLRWRGLPLSFLRARMPSLRDLLVAVGGFVVAFSLVFAALLVISSLDVQTADRADSAALQDPQILLFLIPLAVLLIGPGEELLFRGVIQSTLRETFSAPVAIVLASATFAPAHILAFVGSPSAVAVSIGVLFLPGLAFGAVYEYTENLVVPALSHGIYNAFLFSVSYLAATGAGGTGLLGL